MESKSKPIICFRKMMNKRTILFLVFAFCMTNESKAQNIQITPVVQPTQGGHTQVGNFVLDFTIGEPVYAPLKNGNLMLTQGFEQPEKPLPPVAPASQTVCSDTAYTFVLSNVRAGAGGDKVEWSLNSNCSDSNIIAIGGTISVTVAVGTSDTVWIRSRVSGSGLVSNSIVSTVLTVNLKPESPTPPAPVSVASDTPVVFVFENIQAGFGANQMEWALDSNFTSSHIDTPLCTINLTIPPDSFQLIWLRSKDTATGCMSDTRTTIVIVDTIGVPHIIYDSVMTICTGTSTMFSVANSDTALRYDLKVDTVIVATSFGNDTTLNLSTGNVDTTTVFVIYRTDTIAHTTVAIDTILIMPIAAVDTPFFLEGDTFVFIQDTVCYQAAANNGNKIIYSIISGSTTIDSLTGCVDSIRGNFTVKATAYGETSCGSAYITRVVHVTTISAPVVFDKFVLIDSPKVVSVTLDTIIVGIGGDEIEWATNERFDSSYFVASPAVISIDLEAGSDTVIWVRSHDSDKNKHSRAKKATVGVNLKQLSAGLLDKSKWDIIDTKSDEFSVNDYPDQYVDDLQNHNFPKYDQFRHKWNLIYDYDGGPADANNINNYTLFGNIHPPSEPNKAEVELYDWGNCPVNPNGQGGTGSGHEVSFSNGIAHLTATKFNSPVTATDGTTTGTFTYHSGMLSSYFTIPMTNSMWELRCKVPSNTYTGHGSFPAFWNWSWAADFTIFDWTNRTNSKSATSDQNQRDANGNTYNCAMEVFRQTPCGFDEDWHTFTLVTTPTEVLRFIDGKETWSSVIHNSNFPSGRWPLGIASGFSLDAPIFINHEVYDWGNGSAPSWNSADLQIDYFRCYQPKSAYTQNPVVLQNTLPYGYARTLESPNFYYFSQSNNNIGINRFNHNSWFIGTKPNSKICLETALSFTKIYYTSNNNMCYNVYENSGIWYDYWLGNYGHWVTDVKGEVTTDNLGRTYYLSTNSNKLKYFAWLSSQNNWFNFETGMTNCAGYINADNHGKVFYKGTDNNLYVWVTTGLISGYYSKITTDGSVNGGLAVAKCGCIVFYRDFQNKLRQLTWYNGWRPVITVVNQTIVTNSVTLDEANSMVYFIGSDYAVYSYAWDFNGVNNNANAFKRLGYGTCTNNALSDIALSEDGNYIYYRATDNKIWYYFNDHDPKVSGGNWNKTPLSTYSAGGPIVVDQKSKGGRLFYRSDGTGGILCKVNWVIADNPIACPNANGFVPIASYKTDGTDTQSKNENNDTPTAKDVRDSSERLNILVYPNPSKGTFTFKITDVKDETDVIMKIEEINGREITEFKKHIQSGKNEELIWDAGGMSGGLYYYHATFSNGRSSMGKLVKM